MKPSWLAPIFGTVFLLLGTLLPSSDLVSWMRGSQPAEGEFARQLLTGASLFRAGLAGLGVILLLMPRIWPSHRARREDLPAEKLRFETLAIGGILLAALAARLYQLGAGLWHDEITTYVVYVRTMPLGQIASSYVSENQHFLFNLAARLAVQIFGDSAWSLRLPAVLFGVASIWAVYKLARDVAGPLEALLASALLTVSYHHVWFSQNARGYTALLFWSLLSSWLLIRALARDHAGYWTGYAVAVALGIYSHTSMLFMICGQFLIYARELFLCRKSSWPGRWTGLWFGFGFGGFLTLVLHAPALPQLFSRIGEVSTVPAWKNPLWTLFEILRGLQIGYFGALLVLPALLVFAAGIFSYARSNPIVLQLFFWPVLICGAVVVGLGHHLWPRFFFFACGFAVLIAIRGVLAVGEILGRPKLGLAAAAATIALSGASVPFAYGPKQDYKTALEFVQSNREAGDSVAVVGLAGYAFRNLYGTDWIPVKSVAELEQARSAARRTWLVYSFPPEAHAVYPDVMAAVRRDFRNVRSFPGTLNNGSIYVLRAEGSTAAAAGIR